VFEIAALEEFAHDRPDDRPPETVPLLVTLRVDRLHPEKSQPPAFNLTAGAAIYRRSEQRGVHGRCDSNSRSTVAFVVVLVLETKGNPRMRTRTRRIGIRQFPAKHQGNVE
jgi:hypothetical protein